MARLLAALAALIVLAFPSVASAWDSYPELDETASWLAQRDVKVHCLTEDVITHESGHLRGSGQWWKDEAKTNCWAIRHTGYTALHLGPSVLAPLLVSRAKEWFYGQPEAYQLEGCKVPS